MGGRAILAGAPGDPATGARRAASRGGPGDAIAATLTRRVPGEVDARSGATKRGVRCLVKASGSVRQDLPVLLPHLVVEPLGQAQA